MTGRYALWLWAVRALWYAGLPLALAYLALRGRKDPAYLRHWGERFGFGPVLPGAVWVHAVSLGEMRSAVPLVRALLDRGERVITTHLTPAGRGAAAAAFGPEIAAGQLVARYLPMEFGWAYRRFLRAGPKLALVMEIEVWPVMIAEAKRAGVPLYLANSQYPARSFARDMKYLRWIGHPVQQVAGVLAKSAAHAARFTALGARNVQVCGELRFAQPIAPHLLVAAAALAQNRPVVTLASVVLGEDAGYVGLYQTVQADFRARGLVPPLFVHVPRAPERFGAVGDLLAAAGQTVLRRSDVLDPALKGDAGALAGADILLGDSLGEMYFYLALADLVIVGGGFVPSGAHNIIEPLALCKPVLVGPHVWSIEYPGEEAAEAGVLEVCATPQAMAGRVAALLADPAALSAGSARRAAFFAAHSGATARILAALAPVLAQDDR